jgi:hypothetical protein
MGYFTPPLPGPLQSFKEEAQSGQPLGNAARGVAQTSFRSCEKMNNLTQRRQGAKTRKGQLLCFLCAFYDFAPLREMLLLIQGLFHSFFGMSAL